MNTKQLKYTIHQILKEELSKTNEGLFSKKKEPIPTAVSFSIPIRLKKSPDTIKGAFDLYWEGEKFGYLYPTDRGWKFIDSTYKDSYGGPFEEKSKKSLYKRIEKIVKQKHNLQ